jgi:hypothetical protein
MADGDFTRYPEEHMLVWREGVYERQFRWYRRSLGFCPMEDKSRFFV